MTSRYLHRPQIQTRIPSAGNASMTATSIPAPTVSSYSHASSHHASSSTAPSVRRNLFRHHLSRRPVSATSTSSASTSIIVTGGQGGGAGANSGPGFPADSLSRSTSNSSTTAILTGFDNGDDIESGDIVARDQHGNFKLDITLPPVMGEEDGDETAMEGIEESRPNGGSGNTRTESELAGSDQDKIEASLIELMRRNRGRQLSHEPAEILNLVHQSLHNKVAALDEDNWMYEVEDEIRV